jgi:hypothetical protein
MLQNNEPSFVVPLGLHKDYWKDISFLGYAASLSGDEGLCVQTGHWMEDIVEAPLLSISDIVSLELKSDPHFRQG